jgi:NapC/NirT cytochrome c family protein
MTLVSLLQPDTVAVRTTEPPTPEVLDRFMKWALGGVPQAVQQLGGPLGFVIGGALLALVVWRRRQILAWWRNRSRGFRRAVLGVAAAAVLAAVGTGLYVWDYVQHDNDFCASCHVMRDPFERFQQSEHSELGCHDCHQQPLAASVRQLHLWVANRPNDIGPHAPVPNEVCVKCHVTDDPDSTWQRISTTAGHRIHLEADTSALAEVTCVTCHGSEVHRFSPSDQTCGASGCHDPSTTQVVLGSMAGQTGFHCVTCHSFTAPVAAESPLDTVRMALVPSFEQCRTCHAMEKLLVGLDPEVDPHDAVCGTCHEPHTQELPAVAATRCAECHAPAATLTPFHRGLRAGVLENCVGCHEAHTFRVEGENCVACHADIVGGTPTAGPGAHPGPQTRREEAGPGSFHLAGSAAPVEPAREPAVAPAAILALFQARQQQPGFDHREHRDLECTDCHASRNTHGEVTLESRAQCLDCHHSRRVAATAGGCARCHARGEISAPLALEVAMSIRGQRTARRVGFDHDDHASQACATCHTGGAAMRVQRTCASCHESHHTPAADCTRCHGTGAKEAHARDVHTRGCAGSGCHEQQQYGAMTQGRNTCLACHANMADHRPGRACAACHRVTFAAGAAGHPAGRR